jgi:hypothetical protein
MRTGSGPGFARCRRGWRLLAIGGSEGGKGEEAQPRPPLYAAACRVDGFGLGLGEAGGHRDTLTFRTSLSRHRFSLPVNGYAVGLKHGTQDQ